MNSICFPVHVVALLRRLVNVISGLSISKQYLLNYHNEEKSDVTEDSPDRSTLAELETTKWIDWTGLRCVAWDLNLMSRIGSSRSTVQTLEEYGRRYRHSAVSSFRGRRMTSAPNRIQDFDSHRADDPPVNSPNFEATPPSSNIPSDHSSHGARDTAPDIIHQLLQHPALYDPIRTPRYPIVLCHGLYGFDSRGPSSFPSMRMHYWSTVLQILREKVRAEVIVTSVPSTGSIESRAESLDRQLQEKAFGRGVNLMAHSMGGLDCRHLIAHVKPSQYVPLSLTTICTPHRGSPFMDWCAENIGIGKLARKELEAQRESVNVDQSPSVPPIAKTKAESKPFSFSLASLPSSFTTLLLSVLDSPAYANLTTEYLNNVFNPNTPNDPRVKYFSVAARLDSVNIWHPFWLPKMVLDSAEEKHRNDLRRMSQSNPYPDIGTPLWAKDDEWGNDGLVTVQSAKWGEFLGIMEGCDHWEMRGAKGIEFGVDLPAFPAIGLGGSTTANGNDVGGKSESNDRLNEGWSWMLKAWKRANVEESNAEANVSTTLSAESNGATSKAAVKTTTSLSTSSPSATARKATREEDRARQREKDDDVIKSSTEKLSAVFDWIVEQVPASALLGTKQKEVSIPSGAAKPLQNSRKNELETKLDMERFYIALSRKLYDEGL